LRAPDSLNRERCLIHVELLILQLVSLLLIHFLQESHQKYELQDKTQSRQWWAQYLSLQNIHSSFLDIRCCWSGCLLQLFLVLPQLIVKASDLLVN